MRPHLDVVGNGREKWPEALNLVAQQVEGVGLEQGHTLDLIFSPTGTAEVEVLGGKSAVPPPPHCF